MKKQKSIFLALLFLSMAMLGQVAIAGTAKVSWDANSEGDLDGYKIYYDTTSHAGTCPTGYANNFDVTDNATSHYFDALTPGQTYYFQLTAYDTAANESACAASEVSKLITYRGDINPTPDHRVDVSDLSIIANLFGQSMVHAADINRGGSIDVSDLSILAGEFGQSF